MIEENGSHVYNSHLDDVAEINHTGRIYLSVIMGGGMPPVFVGVESATRDLLADMGGTFPRQKPPE
jgi:hypothetical protein